MKKWKIWLSVILGLIIISVIVTKIFTNKPYKKIQNGNNKSIQEIEEYILNIKSYKAKLNIQVKSNKNENNYIITQEVKENYEMQEVQEPSEISGLQMTYSDGNLEIKNTKLNLNKIYTEYPKISENSLFLTEFISIYEKTESKEIRESDGKIIMTVKNQKNTYNTTQRLYINKSNLKPEKLEITDTNNNAKVYILYNEIEINI